LDNTHTAQITTVLEDHLTVEEDCTEMKNTHVFYTFLASSCSFLNQYVKAKQYLKKQYEVTRILVDDTIAFVAISMIAINYRTIGEYTKSEFLLRSLLEFFL